MPRGQGQAARRLSPEEFDRRRRTMTLLLDYLADHGISAQHVARRVSARLGTNITWARLNGARKGFCCVPPGFIQAACAELEKPVAAVMGEAWVREDGAHFGIGVGASEGEQGHQANAA